jgi:hypothetical protein
MESNKELNVGKVELPEYTFVDNVGTKKDCERIGEQLALGTMELETSTHKCTGKFDHVTIEYNHDDRCGYVCHSEISRIINDNQHATYHTKEYILTGDGFVNEKDSEREFHMLAAYHNDILFSKDWWEKVEPIPVEVAGDILFPNKKEVFFLQLDVFVKSEFYDLAIVSSELTDVINLNELETKYEILTKEIGVYKSTYDKIDYVNSVRKKYVTVSLGDSCECHSCYYKYGKEYYRGGSMDIEANLNSPLILRKGMKFKSILCAC